MSFLMEIRLYVYETSVAARRREGGWGFNAKGKGLVAQKEGANFHS